MLKLERFLRYNKFPVSSNKMGTMPVTIIEFNLIRRTTLSRPLPMLHAVNFMLAIAFVNGVTSYLDESAVSKDNNDRYCFSAEKYAAFATPDSSSAMITCSLHSRGISRAQNITLDHRIASFIRNSNTNLARSER